jgi:preprotein translocase subunit SecG
MPLTNLPKVVMMIFSMMFLIIVVIINIFQSKAKTDHMGGSMRGGGEAKII